MRSAAATGAACSSTWSGSRARAKEGPVLEVRPTNTVGPALYTGYGFRQIGVRRGYYPAHRGREDALVLALDL